jgi:hypothetical protein
MNRLYSSSVVAPTQCNSPRANAGFSICSRVHGALSVFSCPDHGMNFVDKNNGLTLRLWLTQLRTLLSRSSKSPLNFAPASSEAMSSDKTRLPLSESGTSPLPPIRRARPSTMAVFPTPGSPIEHRGCSYCVFAEPEWRGGIPSSRPMTGSNLPNRALSVKSKVYFFNAPRWLSSSADLTVWPPLIKTQRLREKLCRFKPCLRAAYIANVGLGVSQLRQ